jgi:hypothetical protein
MKTIKKTRKELDADEVKKKLRDKKKALIIRKRRLQKDNEKLSK